MLAASARVISPRLEWRRATPEGAAWLASVPRLVSECAERWSLDVGPAFERGAMSVVVRVTRAGGMPAVLKLNFPDEVRGHEAAALAVWAGEGAVRLLAHDEGRSALLLERCVPGDALDDLADESDALAAAIGVLRALWREPPRPDAFRSLRAEAERWAVQIPADWEALGRPFERELVDAAVSGARGGGRGGSVLLHGDFHGGNVLSADRAPWLAIDPIPLVGEPEFDAGSLLRDARPPVTPDRVRRTLDHLAHELGLDRESIRGWGIANALSWGISSEKLETEMVDLARALVSVGAP